MSAIALYWTKLNITEYLVDPSISELSDIQQVVNDLAVIDLGVSVGDVEEVRAAKFAERGGFEGGIGLYVSSGSDD